MRILVYPHDLNMGGSQTNAIELAAAVRDLGHECMIFGQRGVLNSRIDELGLEFIEAPRPSHRPTPWIVSALRRLAIARGIDVIHGYEWPPGMEALLAAKRDGDTRAVCTVMSMSVAPFLPDTMPLIVGTHQIAAHERKVGRHDVHVIEPPVDLEHNVMPASDELESFRRAWPLDGRPLVVCVSRLANELKAEGILTAIAVADEMIEGQAFQLMIVGDGPARQRIEDAAHRVNSRRAGTIILTGELADPRPAYAIADVGLGMGGSALRSMAFGVPLIVQGENGFFRTLTPETVDLFKWQGWYGMGEGDSGSTELRGELVPLLASPTRRQSLRAFAHSVVNEFSLETAAHRQVRIYQQVLDSGPSLKVDALPDGLRSTTRFARYFARQQIARMLRRTATDDFNATPVVATADRARRGGALTPDTDGPIIYLPGVEWDAVAGTDRQLVEELVKLRPVIWVDPPRSVAETVRRGKRVPSVSQPIEGLTRISVNVLPGSARPGLNSLARWTLVRQLRRYLGNLGLAPSAIVASGPEPILADLGDIPGTRIYFATDDFVAAAPLWNRSASGLARAREKNLASANLVLAVTRELADVLRRSGTPTVWFPNGANTSRFVDYMNQRAAPEVSLAGPMAGVIGQFNERTDFQILKHTAESGVRLLLIGPRGFHNPTKLDEFTSLAAHPNVQWIDRVPRKRLGEFYACLSVGLTAYADSTFNRRSYPLKTVEYLAAGIPVVATDVAPVDGLDLQFIDVASSAEEFVHAVQRWLARDAAPRSEVQSTVTGQDWSQRATRLLQLLEKATTTM
ncbi:glycosyltransferase [Brooklawnia sp.]|uniref:glycosyltransferase n=1 Tax=Brooklawnia sp. TaxID=2699740 RepID=UPI00311EBB95